MTTKHKFENIIQVGDAVKYKNGDARYIVRMIHHNGSLCDIVRDNQYAKEYPKCEISRLEIIEKNINLLSHKEIEEFTLSKSYREKTNPHKKAHMPTQSKITTVKMEKDLDYLITVFAPLTSVKSEAGVNDNVYSRKVLTGKKALGKYILELDSASVKHLREVRVLGRQVKIDIKREVVIK